MAVTANGSIDARFGVDAENFGSGATSVTTVGPVTATSGNGVFAKSSGGTVTVTAGDVSSTGATAIVARQTNAAGSGAVAVSAGTVSGTTGIEATNAGSGTVGVTTTGPVTGTLAEGIKATGNNAVSVSVAQTVSGATEGLSLVGGTGGAGDILVTGTGGFVGGTGNAATIQNNGSGTVTMAISGASSSTAGEGIVVRDVATSTGISVTTGAVTALAAGKDAIDVQSQSLTGNVTVNTNGAIAGAARGILGSVQGAGNVVINVNVDASATNGTAVEGLRQSGTGTITINQAVTSVITATNGNGISANSGTATGATTINVAGEVQATGTGNAGVRAISTGGAITVNGAATGKIDPDFGIALDTVDGALTVNNSGLVTGTVAGVQLVATGTGNATLSNSGTITGGANAVVGALNGGTFTLTNTGTLNGGISVTGSNVATSTMTNGAGATANFGSGASTFSGRLSNAGTMNLGAGGTVVFLGNVTNANRIDLAGAGTFTTSGAMTNNGIISAQNNLTGNVVTVGGNYTGGGQFFADYNDVTATADHLNITGSVSGITNVSLNRVGPAAFVAGGFLPVVTVTPGAAARAFTSDTVFPTSGFVLESFGQSPSSNAEFGVIQTVNPAAGSLGSLSRVAEAVTTNLDEPISPYLVGSGTGAENRPVGLWIRGTAGYTKEILNSSIVGGGITLTSVDRLVTHHESLQFGADFSIPMGAGGWNLHLGAMGGWYGANADTAGAGRVHLSAPFLGAYATLDNGPFTLEGAIRHEWRKFTVHSESLFGSAAQRADGSATAGSIRASYRIGGARGFAATPAIGFTYGDSHIDDLVIGPNDRFATADYRTKVGQAGVRLSYLAETPGGLVIEPFAGAALRRNWSRFDRGTYSFGSPATMFELESVSWRSAVRYSAGFTARDTTGHVAMFVIGTVDDGARVDSANINLGFRVRF